MLETSKGQDEITQGNHWVDQAAKVTGFLRQQFTGALIPSLRDPVPPISYTSADRDWAIQKGYILNSQRWCEPNKKLHLLQFLQWKVIKEHHESYHLG